MEETLQKLQRENEEAWTEQRRIKAQCQAGCETAYNHGLMTNARKEPCTSLPTTETSRICEGIAGINNELKLTSCCAQIRPFDGTNMDRYLDWMSDIRKAIPQLLPDDGHAARSLVTRTVTGNAADFVARILQTRPNITWTELNKLLDERYTDEIDVLLSKKQLRHVTQRTGENVYEFYERIMKLSNRIYGEQLTNPIIQSDLVDIFTEGIYDHEIIRELVKSKPTTLEQALQIAATEQQANRLLHLRIRRNKNPSTEKRVEINAIGGHTEQEKNKTQKDEDLKKPVNVRNRGHTLLSKDVPNQIDDTHLPDHKTRDMHCNSKASELLLNSHGRNHKTDSSLRNSTESMERVNQHLPGSQFGTKHNKLPKSDKRKCYNCQQPGHIAKNCRKLSEKERQTECYRCHKIGHYRKNCRMNAAPKKVRFAKNA